MNILLINHYAGSTDMGMEFRPYYMAREWVKDGHRVDIIAANFSHLRRKNPVIEKDWQEEVIDGIHYHWIKTLTYDGNGVKRALTMFQFVGKIWLKAKYIAKNWKPDVIITSSTYPLDTYAGQRIKKYSKGGVKLIHEIHDVWPLSPVILGGMSKNNPFIWVMQKAEDSFCRHSDKVVAIMPCAKEHCIRHGMEADKYYNVQNGVVLEDWKDPAPLPDELQEIIDRLKAEDRFIICFFGSHTNGYNLENLIDAVKTLNDKSLAVLFVGEGVAKEALKKQAGNDKRFIFYGYIPKRSIPSLTSAVDVIFVGARPSPLQKYGISMNKLFDSMMGGKPIIFAADVPNDYISEFNCGITVRPDDKEQLKNAILTLKNMDPDKRTELGENGRKAVIDNFNYDVLSHKFENILME